MACTGRLASAHTDSSHAGMKYIARQQESRKPAAAAASCWANLIGLGV